MRDPGRCEHRLGTEQFIGLAHTLRRGAGSEQDDRRQGDQGLQFQLEHRDVLQRGDAGL